MKQGADEICLSTASQIAAMVREKRVSPVEVVEAFLDRIDRVNPAINAYCTIAREEAMDQARGSEKDVMVGSLKGPLHGVPVAIKDLTPTAGIRTTMGSKIFENNIPESDSVFVERVKKAGGIIIGKTNTPEFGHKAVTDNLLFGHTRNPWDTGKIAGGSSGGSAAAVAAGIAPLAEGSDGGGSVRIPSSACGVYGLKPGYGRIPMDIMPSGFSSGAPFSHHGVIAGNVSDAALLLSVVAGPHSRDPFSLPDTGDDFSSAAESPGGGLRVAFSVDLGYFTVQEQVREAVKAAAAVYAESGCLVDEVNPGFENPAVEVLGLFNTMWCVHFASYCEEYLDKWGHSLSPGIKAMIRVGREIPAADYKKTELMRQRVWQVFEDILARYDIIITPTLAVPAFDIGRPGPKEIDGTAVDPYSGWYLTYPFNLTGHPAASIPCGLSSEGLPIGLQIIGRRFDEKTVLKASALMEKMGPWKGRRPAI